MVPELKELFTILAESETRYLKNLAGLSATEKGRAGRLAALDGSVCCFPSGALRTEAMLRTDPDGYRHIVSAEEELLGLYAELAAHTDNRDDKRLLDTLVEQEQRHLSEVEHIYDFVETPRTFLAWGEFSNLREY